MYEASTDQITRDAIRGAHEARGKIVRDVWKSLFGRGAAEPAECSTCAA